MSLERARFAAVAAVFFALATVPRLLTHELWRDEAWLWLVVGESQSLPALFASLARSGQGYLFPWLCYLARGLQASPLAMQCVHLVLAVAGVYVFTRWAPLSRVQRALFVLGYLPFYEYAVISRHYVAGALLLWLACAAARSRRPALGLGAALGLLCQTTVYGFLLAVAVAAGWLCDLRLRQRPGAAPLASPAAGSRREIVVGLLLAVAGGIAGLVQLVPAPGTSFAEPWRFGWQPEVALRVLQMPWRAFALVPRFGLHFWNSNLLDAWPALQAAAGAAVLLAVTAFLWPRKAALATWLVGAAGLAAFGYVKYVGVLRHDGHWWLLFAAALWLGGGLPSQPPASGGSPRRRDGRATALGVVLALHAAVGAYASWMDLAHPFSNGARTAAEIRRLGWDELPLLGYREPPAAAVALALGRPLFAPSRGLFTTHPDWGPEQRDLSPHELRCAARAFAARERRDIGLVINSELPPWEEVEPAGEIVGAIQASEDYHLYRLRHASLASTSAAAACPDAAATPGD